MRRPDGGPNRRIRRPFPMVGAAHCFLIRAKMMPFALELLRSAFLFVTAGVCEIAGGWLIWRWLRDGKPGWWGLLGGVVLVLYGVVPTFQPSHFGRTYAAYGGFFIVLS